MSSPVRGAFSAYHARFIQIEKNQAFVQFVQRKSGRILLFSFCALILSRTGRAWLPISIGAAICAFSDRYRNVAIALTTAAVLVSHPAWFPVSAIRHVLQQEGLQDRSAQGAIVAAALSGYFLFALGCLWVARRRPDSLLARRPVVSLLALMGIIVLCTQFRFLQGGFLVGVWSFASVFAAYIWFLAYGLVDQRTKNRSPLVFQIGIFHPFWGSSSTPFGKGAAYLRKTLAKSPGERAVTQIKGLKLLIWASLLLVIHKALNWSCVHLLNIPTITTALESHISGRPYPAALNLASLVWDTADEALDLAVGGHITIACARLAGFRLLRNTWRPLGSRTLADFWNRYYYYFKELLVEFFFLPTFLRFFRKQPRLRVFFATFMAAGVGNAVFHFVRDINLLVTLGPLKAVTGYQSYLFYCALLATGIGISQVRNPAHVKRAPPTAARRVWSFVCIWSFIVALHLFGSVESREYSLKDRLSFMAHGMGVEF